MPGTERLRSFIKIAVIDLDTYKMTDKQLECAEKGEKTETTGSTSLYSPRVIANLTHELKTPLHSILAVASILNSEIDGVLNAEQKRQVGIIISNGEQLLDLITGMLQFSTTASSIPKANLRRVSLQQFFNDLVAGVASYAQQRGVHLKAECSNLTPRFYTDPLLLHRIINNLLNNAIKFSTLEGEVSFTALNLKDGSLQIEVAVSGVGIPPELQDQIFNEFYQAESDDSRRFGGVGLGLFLVKSAVKALTGTIELKSEKGKGSLFCINIPDAQLQADLPKILLYEEDSLVKRALAECLKAEAYNYRFLSETDELVSAVADFKPKLLILELRSPDFKAFSWLQEVRKSVWGAALPIILLSTIEDPQYRAKAFQLGASDFILKPFNLDELFVKIRLQMERAS